MLGAAVTFSLQNGLSRLLAETYGVLSIVAVRYWFFLLLVIGCCMTRPGGIRAVARTKHPWLQTLRGVLLITDSVTRSTVSC